MPVAAQFNFPDPNYEAQNEALHERWEQNAQAIDTLQNVGMNREARQLALRSLMELSNRAYTMARTLGLHAIAEGEMSRVELSRQLGVHQATVARWIEEAQTEPDHDYSITPLTRVHRKSYHKAG
jgi:Trp operon repressor